MTMLPPFEFHAHSTAAYLGAVRAEFARSGDVDLLYRAAVLLPENAPGEAHASFAHLALSPLVDPTDSVYLIALLDPDHIGYRARDRVFELIQADPAFNDLYDAAAADKAPSTYTGAIVAETLQRIRPTAAARARQTVEPAGGTERGRGRMTMPSRRQATTDTPPIVTVETP